jgi:hypothetical protein
MNKNRVSANVKKTKHFDNHRISMHDYEGIRYPDIDTKRAVIDKMLADKINELFRIVDELEHKSK